MILLWNDAKSFRQHVEDMRSFHRLHLGASSGEGLKLLQNMPVPFDVVPPSETRRITSFTDSRGKIIIVPIWKTTLSRGSQN